VLAVLHDLNLAAAFAPRVVMLDAGRVAADGPPDEVLTPEPIERIFGVRMEPVVTSTGLRTLALDL
jgi:iron complex transport system ATP-binding protein